MARFCLNMIVKNESARIVRALESVAPYIYAYVIVDTGSIDDTKAKIKAFFDASKIPGIIRDAPFVDWSQARNAALSAGRAYAPTWGCDYLLLTDADMDLVVTDAHCFADLTGASYDMYQRVNSLEYVNRRLVRVDSVGDYVGVTHEYLNVEAAGCVPLSAAYFNDHADGANRPEKFKRDINLLLEGLRKEPDNSRYFFYLAQSYKDAGKLDRAIKWYKRRVDAGGWEEEQWYAQYALALCYLSLKKDDEFIRNMQKAYNLRPQRTESLYQLANHYRVKGENALATMYAETAIHTPPTTDMLFVDKFQTTVGPADEFAISGFYIPWRREEAFKVADRLSITAGPYEGPRQTARSNMYFYLHPLSDYCPSFKSQNIEFKTEDKWTALNPSVALVHGRLYAVIRTVNYTMDEEGRYIIQGTDGTANATNPINTRNFLVGLDRESFAVTEKTELLPPGNLPCEFPLVIGFEDMRLFQWKDQLWTSSTVRQIHPDGMPEQVLARIDDNRLVDVKRMLRAPRVCEKNWMPVVDEDRLSFVWRLGEVVNTDGETIAQHHTTLSTDRLSGSSKLVAFNGGWIAVVHEAQTLPGSHKRYYYHRFVQFDKDLRPTKISKPFYFNQKLIEFCAGLCRHPDGDRLVISYGEEDKEARLATVLADEVKRMEWISLNSKS